MPRAIIGYSHIHIIAIAILWLLVLDNPLEATQIVCRADFWGRVNGVKSFNLIVLINDFFKGYSPYQVIGS